jgi:hypothetical protein
LAIVEPRSGPRRVLAHERLVVVERGFERGGVLGSAHIA